MADGLRAAGHEVIGVLLERDGRWTAMARRSTLRAGGGLLDAEVAFPVLHGPFGEDGTVQGLLECLDVPYAGPGVLAAAVAIDKLIFKRVLAFHDIPQVGFCEVGEDGWREQVAAMGLPLWVKPARLGSSVGISKVTSPERGLDEAVELARRHDPRVIVEAHGGGKEVECSVIGNEAARDLAAGRDRRPRRLVRLRGQVLRGRHGPDRPGADHRGRRRRGYASSPRRSSGRSTAPASPAAISSSATTARFWSTS